MHPTTAGVHRTASRFRGRGLALTPTPAALFIGGIGVPRTAWKSCDRVLTRTPLFGMVYAMTKTLQTPTDTATREQAARACFVTHASVLKSLRFKRRISRADFAEAIGVSSLSVWLWETGRRTPLPAHALAYIEALERVYGEPILERLLATGPTAQIAVTIKLDFVAS